jgi:hypothetical protein
MGYNLSEEGRKLAEQYQLGMFRGTYTAKVSRLNIGILIIAICAICICVIGLIIFSANSFILWHSLPTAGFFAEWKRELDRGCRLKAERGGTS